MPRAHLHGLRQTFTAHQPVRTSTDTRAVLLRARARRHPTDWLVPLPTATRIIYGVITCCAALVARIWQMEMIMYGGSVFMQLRELGGFAWGWNRGIVCDDGAEVMGFPGKRFMREEEGERYVMSSVSGFAWIDWENIRKRFSRFSRKNDVTRELLSLQFFFMYLLVLKWSCVLLNAVVTVLDARYVLYRKLVYIHIFGLIIFRGLFYVFISIFYFLFSFYVLFSMIILFCKRVFFCYSNLLLCLRTFYVSCVKRNNNPVITFTTNSLYSREKYFHIFFSLQYWELNFHFI